MKSVHVYYSVEQGYIVEPLVKAKPIPIWVAVEPILSFEAGASIDALAKAIEEVACVSEKHEPVDYKEAQKNHYWEKYGFKSYGAFSKKYSLVSIYDNDVKVEVVKQVSDKHGGYYPSKMEGDTIILECSTDYLTIANAVIQLLGMAIGECAYVESIETLGNSHVKYPIPCDDLEYCGDGGTDAYALYRETDTENYIVFLIDNGYEAFDEESIHTVLERQFGTFDEFEYDDSKEDRIVISARNSKCSVQSNLYHKEDDSFELLSYVENDESVVPQEYKKIVDSLSITWA